MDDLQINIADIGVVAVLLISALLAYARGFVHEVLAVAGWIGAIFATIYGFPYLKPYARDLVSIELVADLGAGVAIFVVSAAVLSLVTRGASKLMRSSAFNLLDRSLGFLFGALRGAVLVCLVYLGTVWVLSPAEEETAEDQDPRPQWLLEARSLPLIEEGSEIIKSLVPKDDAAALEEARDKALQFDRTRKVWSEMLNPRAKGEEPGETSGYGDKERQDMERLIDSNQ